MATPAECGVQVFCRIRPMNKKEEDQQEPFYPKFPTGTEDSINLGGKIYVFDRVFKPNTTQEQVYKGAAYHIVQDVLNGYNGTVFAYGQTSSGKTHTMEGVFENAELQGIIPRIVADIFDHIFNMDEKLEFQIKVSYFEIYNEKIRDLLDMTKTNLAIHEDKNRVPYVKGATEQAVSSPEEIMGCIETGKSNRIVAVTNMNEHSSRSHSVFLISIQQTHTETKKQLNGKLYLVDLAGSEKVSKTGAEGMQFEEAKNINKSLTTLGMVISALAEGNKSHIPYRDSKLTRILQESLGGNSRTTVIICASPARYNSEETKSTLQFGQRAKTIKNVVAINEELSADEWKRRYEREKEKVARLKAQLTAAQLEIERWRSGDRVPESDWISFAEGATMPIAALGQDITPSSESMLLSMDRSIAAAPPMLTSNNGPITDDDRRKYEEERANLFQQLDDKDDEIQTQSQKVEQFRQQMTDLEEQISTLRQEREICQAENAAMLKDNEAAKEETKEVLNALEELAVNYDAKVQEADQKNRENEQFAEDVNKKTLELAELTAEMEAVREQLSVNKKRLQDSMQQILKELQELDNNVKVNFDADNSKDDEMMAHVRICISKLTSDYKTHKQKLLELESGSDGAAKQLETAERELNDLKLHNQQSESKVKNLQETIDKQEKQKRELEEQIDSLTARLSASTVSGDTAAVASSEEHHKQVSQLRDEIAEKNKQVEQLSSSLKEMEVVRDQLTSEMEKLRSEEAGKEKKIKELSAMSDKREQARQDLRGLEETVEKELGTLSNLRRLFVADLAAKMKRIPGSDASGVEDEFSGSPAQKQKILFLENNLDQLTKVHKQLVRDNADLRLELPKLEKRLRTTTERVKNLEQALRETKENAMRDRKKYQNEVERIKEAVRQRNLARKGVSPQIVKTIRPGQVYSSGQPAPMMRPANAGQMNAQ